MSALSAAEAVSSRNKYAGDLIVYIESTLIANHLSVDQKQRLLVTEDYKFFKAFIRSNYAQEAFKDLMMKVLKLKDVIQVKLAEEIIEGMWVW